MVREGRSARLLGVGLDNDDGHVRVTRGPNYHLVGGSHDTHMVMQEKCIRFNEKLDARGKGLADLSGDELREIATECGMDIKQRPDKG